MPLVHITLFEEPVERSEEEIEELRRMGLVRDDPPEPPKTPAQTTPAKPEPKEQA
jgi:hypothetical protein